MANYCCTIRSNYFHVNDEAAFEEFMGRVYGSEDNVELWKEKAKDGSTMYGFGCYGGIGGVRNAKADEDDDSDESAYDEFISGLQQFVCADDAIIILESGNEKMRYVIGSATVVTRDKYKYLDITSIAKKTAAALLGKEDFQTQCEY